MVHGTQDETAEPAAGIHARALRLSATPGHLIRRAQQVHTALWAERLHAELTGPQYAVLVSLAQEPGIDQTRLAELASLDKNTTADLVRRLVRQGWVIRSVDDGDLRRRVLWLSTPAKVAMRHITPAAKLVQEDLLEPVPDGQRSAVVEMLASIAFQEGAPASAAAPGDVPVLAQSRTPGYLIRRSQQVHGGIWSRHVGTELTGPQYAVLAALAAEPGADQVTVGRLASLDKSSTADIVARLERGGWIRRANRPGSGRRSVLTLTPAAEENLDRLTPRVAAVQEEFLSPLSPGETRSFTSLLARIAYRGSPPREGLATPRIGTGGLPAARRAPGGVAAAVAGIH